ncbi:hypothetical protein ACFS2C_00075 [Prauserella oleivorans]|uniref:DUF2631 domain-containing protein n=1 Tax=Prauserella oleivorans TaxID=1478153 RepID=A0ABW5W1I4_9PSEU
MAEQDEQQVTRRRPRVDAFPLLAGLATLFVSVYVLSDGPDWLGSFDLRWVLAGAAVLAGTLMLIASMRGDRNRD